LTAYLRTGQKSVLDRSRTVGNYDRGYQNSVPGAVTADKTLVTLSAYNNATRRTNVFNQTDVTYALETGAVRELERHVALRTA
jgi:hypothetical protein